MRRLAVTDDCEVLQPVDFKRLREMPRRVVAEHNDFDILQAHTAIGLRPAAIVADAHAHNAVHGIEDGKPKIARLEIGFLQMLERPPRFVFVMAGQVHLSVFAGDLAFTVDNDCRVEMAILPFSSVSSA